MKWHLEIIFILAAMFCGLLLEALRFTSSSAYITELAKEVSAYWVNSKSRIQKVKNVYVHRRGSITCWAQTRIYCWSQDRRVPRVQEKLKSTRALLYLVILIMCLHAHCNNPAFAFNGLAVWVLISRYQALATPASVVTLKDLESHYRCSLTSCGYSLQVFPIICWLFWSPWACAGITGMWRAPCSICTERWESTPC